MAALPGHNAPQQIEGPNEVRDDPSNLILTAPEGPTNGGAKSASTKVHFALFRSIAQLLGENTRDDRPGCHSLWKGAKIYRLKIWKR